MTEVTYRLGTEDDFPAVARMYTKLDALLRQLSLRTPQAEDPGQAYVESFRRTLGRFSILYVAEIDGEVVAYQLARIKRLPAYHGGAMVGETGGKWTEPQARRLGIGTQLARMAFEWMREQGAQSVEFMIPDGNQASIELFEGLGARPEWHLYRLTWDDYDQPQSE